jgi:hypothetical protein
VTARRFVINVLIFLAVIIVMTALAIWLNLGPVASSGDKRNERATAMVALLLWVGNDAPRPLGSIQ